MVMIQAVIFDCFGVLAYDGWLAFREKYFEGKPHELEQAITSNRQVDAGLIGYDQFVAEIAGYAGVTEDETRRVLENNPPNEKLFAYIRDTLKPHYKIGMLSNAGDNWLSDIFVPSQVALFDEIVLSYQLHAIKPDPIMYETIAARLGTLPEECVFIDDQQRFVEGAERVGMKGIVFTDTATTIAELERTLHA